jgi:hypothetical protein
MTHIELEAMKAILRIADSLETISAGVAALVKQNEQRLAREARTNQTTK